MKCIVLSLMDLWWDKQLAKTTTKKEIKRMLCSHRLFTGLLQKAKSYSTLCSVMPCFQYKSYAKVMPIITIGKCRHAKTSLWSIHNYLFSDFVVVINEPSQPQRND